MSHERSIQDDIDDAEGPVAEHEMERRMLLSLIFSMAEWVDLVINEWKYPIGGDEFPQKFLENAKSVGWERHTDPKDYDW